jgi:metal-responsive CopG/Arc/MetJ family transcriptional regulator
MAPQQQEPHPKPPPKRLMNAVLQTIVEEIDELIKKRGYSYRAQAEVIEKYRKYTMEAGGGQWLNNNRINYYRRVQQKKAKDEEAKAQKLLNVTDNSLNVLANAITSIQSQEEHEAATTTNLSTLTDTGMSQETDISSLTMLTTIGGGQSYKHVGRRKGSTKQSLLGAKRRKIEAVNFAANRIAEKKQESLDCGLGRMPNGTYRQIIDETQSKYGLESGSLNM